MARSVSVPHNAILVDYAVLDGDIEEWDFTWAVDNFRNELEERFPSLTKANYWLGREDRAVADNGLVTVTVSEYCGLVALSVVPQEGKEVLAARWVKQITPRFHEACFASFGPLFRPTARFSNGEVIYNRVDGERVGGLGIGFSSKEGPL